MRGVLANRRRTADTPDLAAQGQSVSRKTVAEVPLAGLPLIVPLAADSQRVTPQRSLTARSHSASRCTVAMSIGKASIGMPLSMTSIGL
jgi:hypothetical protein